MSEGMKILIDTYSDPSPSNFKKLVSVMAFDQSMATDELVEQRSANALAHPEHLDTWGRMMREGGAFEYCGIAGRLPEIVAPTLVVQGRDDRTVNLENALRLVSAISNSRLVIFNRCGHWAQLEHADEFNRLVEQFVLNN